MKNPHYAYIDALRGYAILAVIVTHSFPLSSGLTGAIRKIVDQGARGVELFFLVSALTLMMSWYAKHDGIARFYVRRLFRIVPLFWLGLIFYSFPAYWSFTHIQWEPILNTAFFINGWSPSYFNNVVPGGWSIVVEMNFYLIFPLLVYFFRNRLGTFLGLIVSIIFAYWSFKLAHMDRHLIWPSVVQENYDATIWFFLNLWLPNQLPTFITGILLYFVIQSDFGHLPKWGYRTLILLALIMMALLAIRPDPWTILKGYLSIYTAYSFLFSIIAFSFARGGGGYLVNWLVINLGRISFSAYLWHFFVINHVASFFDAQLGGGERSTIIHLEYLVLILLITATLSLISYHLIEKPMISLGNRLIEIWNQRKDPARNY